MLLSLNADEMDNESAADETHQALDSIAAADQPSVPSDLEERWNAEWEDNLLYAAIERVRHRFDPKQFHMFDLAVLRQWSTERIRSFLKVSTTSISVAKHRVLALVKKDMNYLRTKCA